MPLKIPSEKTENTHKKEARPSSSGFIEVAAPPDGDVNKTNKEIYLIKS